MTHVFNIEQAEAVIRETMLDLHACLKLEDEEPQFSVSRQQTYSYSDITRRDYRRLKKAFDKRVLQHTIDKTGDSFPLVSITQEEKLRFEQEEFAKLKAEDARDPLHHCQDHPPLHPFATFKTELKFAVRQFKLSPSHEADVDAFKASFKTAQDNFINQYKKKMHIIENPNDARNNTADYTKIEQIKRACKVLLGVLLGIILCPALLSSNYRDWLGHTFFEKQPDAAKEADKGTSITKEVLEDTEDSRAIQHVFDTQCAAM